MTVENTKLIFLKPVLNFMERDDMGIISQRHWDRIKIYPCLGN